MSDAPKIEPSKITRPIQLLAAWLAGLVLVDTLYLTAAVNIRNPSWGAATLIVASVLNTPIFLAALFLLQTRFRPEMQEDQFYYRYLEQRFSKQTMSTELVEISPPAMPIEPRRFTQAAPSRPSSVLTRISAGNFAISGKLRVVRGLQINHNMKEYEAIRDDLLGKNLAVAGTFGSSDGRTPKNFVISFGEGRVN